MTLLLDLMRDSGDPGYDDAAAARVARGEPATRRGRADRVLAVVALLVVGLLLAAAIVQTRGAAPAVEAARRELLTRVEVRSAANDDLLARIGALRVQVDWLQASALSESAAGRALAARLAELEFAAQYVAVAGPATIVTLADAPGAGKADDPSKADLGRVLDRDIQTVVNGLWQAGAEALAVNDQRLSSRSAIRSAGGAILVNYRPLLPPYRVQAIGDPQTLTQRFEDGPAGRALVTLRDTYGIRFAVASEPSITLPAATSSLPTQSVVVGGTP